MLQELQQWIREFLHSGIFPMYSPHRFVFTLRDVLLRLRCITAADAADAAENSFSTNNRNAQGRNSYPIVFL
jgi:hypothetical protein